MKVGRLLLRGTIGSLFFAHGTQKLFGWFGGHGLDGTAQFFESLGMRPGRLNALAAGAAETGGGALMLLGLATPLAASAITSVMLTAINRIHAKNGPWNSEGGYEYNLALIAAAAGLAEVGPGSPSLDSVLGIEWHGPRWALAALAAGAAGAVGAHLYAQSQPTQSSAPETAAQPQPAAPPQNAEAAAASQPVPAFAQ
jgi:putative oxidoreductase